MKLKTAFAWLGYAVLAALYTYATVAAVGNFTGMTGFIGDALSPLARILLVLGIGIPPLVFAGALLIARRRGPGTRILLLATGLCVVAAWQLGLLHVLG